jgi:hypothetical protein
MSGGVRPGAERCPIPGVRRTVPAGRHSGQTPVAFIRLFDAKILEEPLPRIVDAVKNSTRPSTGGLLHEQTRQLATLGINDDGDRTASFVLNYVTDPLAEDGHVQFAAFQRPAGDMDYLAIVQGLRFDKFGSKAVEVLKRDITLGNAHGDSIWPVDVQFDRHSAIMPQLIDNCHLGRSHNRYDYWAGHDCRLWRPGIVTWIGRAMRNPPFRFPLVES